MQQLRDPDAFFASAPSYHGEAAAMFLSLAGIRWREEQRRDDDARWMVIGADELRVNPTNGFVSGTQLERIYLRLTGAPLRSKDYEHQLALDVSPIAQRAIELMERRRASIEAGLCDPRLEWESETVWTHDGYGQSRAFWLSEQTRKLSEIRVALRIGGATIPINQMVAEMLSQPCHP